MPPTLRSWSPLLCCLPPWSHLPEAVPPLIRWEQLPARRLMSLTSELGAVSTDPRSSTVGPPISSGLAVVTMRGCGLTAHATSLTKGLESYLPPSNTTLSAASTIDEAGTCSGRPEGSFEHLVEVKIVTKKPAGNFFKQKRHYIQVSNTYTPEI